MAKYKKEMFVLNTLYGTNLNEWDIITPSSIFKDEFKNNEAEKELILSYANALNCIVDSIIKQNHEPGTIMTLRRDSLILPFIFLARHTVELTLKYLCGILNIEFQLRHGLMTLWNQIVEKFIKYGYIQNDELEDIRIFIEALEELDCDGSHSRYSKDRQGKLYNDRAKFINVKNINNFIQEFFIKLVNSISIAKTI